MFLYTWCAPCSPRLDISYHTLVCRFPLQTDAKFIQYKAASRQLIADLTAQNEDLKRVIEEHENRRRDIAQPKKKLGLLAVKFWKAPVFHRRSDGFSIKVSL